MIATSPTSRAPAEVVPYSLWTVFIVVGLPSRMVKLWDRSRFWTTIPSHWIWSRAAWNGVWRSCLALWGLGSVFFLWGLTTTVHGLTVTTAPVAISLMGLFSVLSFALFVFARPRRLIPPALRNTKPYLTELREHPQGWLGRLLTRRDQGPTSDRRR